MTAKKLAAGDIIVARCTRCRALLNHTIVAMVGERVVRVECNTCHGVHNYIGEKTAVASSPRAAGHKGAPGAAKAVKEPGAAEREEWQALLAEMGDRQAIPYDMAAGCRVNNLVEHATFGLGIVRLVTGNKMEVLFRSGKKLLRCS